MLHTALHSPRAEYAGDLSPREAWAMLQSESGGLLIDVRTPEEWRQTGIPDGEAMFEPWSTSEGHNPDFLARLAERHPHRNAPLFFLCRVGGRSREAAIAATRMGYARAYNIANGFEGDPDANGERGRVNGWKADGLPWRSL